MATESEIATVRELINEPDDTNGWTTERIEALIDANAGNLRLTASDIWTSKATKYTTLVDMSENGSSRKLSDIHKNALAMARQFRSESDGIIAAQENRPTTRAIVRP